MPFKLKEIGGKFEVMNLDSGKTYGRTSKSKAESQMRLLTAIKEGGFKPMKKGCMCKAGKMCKMCK